MSVKWEKLEGNTGVLTIEVAAERVDANLDIAFKKVIKKINVPGFRKGKMPRKLFEQRFGVEQLYADALDLLIPESYEEAVKETGIKPIDRPEIDVTQIEKGKALLFTANVQLQPEVTLGEYKGLEVEKLDATVTDEDVQSEIATLQERFAELVIKEGAAEDGDTVVIDFEGFVGDEVFEGGQADNYSLQIGSGSFIPGFEEQIIGATTGEKRDVTVTFPEEYHATHLAGKEAIFKVTVHEIKATELPELDDEFAKDTEEEVETLEELQTKIRTRLEEEKALDSENAFRDTIVDKACENATMEIPEVMINVETKRMVREFESRLQSQGLNLETYFQFSGQNEEQLQEQMKDEAETRVRITLTLEEIANVENITVSDEEIDEELQETAGMYGMDIENLRSMLGSSDRLYHDLLMRKVAEFLIENSKNA